MNELGMGSRPQYLTIRITLYNVILFPILPSQSGKNAAKIDLESRLHETAKVSSVIRDQVVPLLVVY